EEEIILPDGLVASIDNLIVIAAMMGSLLSTEGKITIGIYSNISVNYLDIDTNELCDVADIHIRIAELREIAELTQPNVLLHADIEVTDGQN
ncbi:hypothetical protein KKJ06_23075, partial [Xenorhabdus bovienii]|uniref:hypothetical protein n=1 Tax=Xenorhabdus bovienii TaxID=40576 RepID=UPI0023B32D85